MDVAAPLHALVVDDNPLVLIDACHILEEAGFVCLDAHDGEKAWQVIGEHGGEITLLFSDVEMPGGVNGFDLARKVWETYPAMEIVLASGRVRPRPEDLPGNTTFVSKPFSAALVHDHLRTKLPDHKMPEPLRITGSRQCSEQGR